MGVGVGSSGLPHPYIQSPTATLEVRISSTLSRLETLIMGSTPQADVPGNLYLHTVFYPSRASADADSILPFMGPGQAIDLIAAEVEFGAAQVGSATNYADIKIVNKGTASAGTAVLASRSFSATTANLAANVAGSMTPSATSSAAPHKASSERLAVSYDKNGNGIDLVAHAVHMAYRYR